tara:strand:- start:177 stop:650 length:474 start_codon:yes stop_codon:yes gene_type:complete
MWWHNYIDNKGQITLTVDKAIDILHSGGDIKNFVLQSCQDVNKYNSNNSNFLKTSHRKIQWLMPDKYLNLNIENFFKQFNLTPLQNLRVEQELNLYKSRNLYIVLKLMIYIVDIMNKENIVWGVGRGSSVSSYLLYLIGVHKVDSLKYNLDIKEFIK